jgi:hypothetical protein
MNYPRKEEEQREMAWRILKVWSFWGQGPLKGSTLVNWTTQNNHSEISKGEDTQQTFRKPVDWFN